MNRNYWTISRHLVFWIAYAFYFYIVNKLGNSQLSFWTVLYSMPFFILIYYGISYSLNVHLYNKRYILAILIAFLIYGITFIGIYLLTHGWPSSIGLYADYFTSKPNFSLRKFLQNYLKLIGNFSIFAFLGYQYRLKLLSMEQQQQEHEWRRRYEYTTLTQQVSPHLLANIFQSLERQLSEVRPELRKRIVELYSVMRYFMDSTRPEERISVLLEQEIQATKQFISIYDSFSSRKSIFYWQVTGNIEGTFIPSTGLITLVSNVFKHGDPYDRFQPATIQVCVQRDQFKIIVSNKVRLAKASLESHGVGLENLRGRLEYAYNGNFKLNHSLKDGTFQVHLIVNL